MNRRSAIRAAVGPLIAVLVVGAGPPASSAPVAAASVTVAVPAAAPVGPRLPATVPASPPPTTTPGEFQPEDENAECLGLLERPGCGSKDRGGWRQTMVFGVMLAGLAAVFGRIGYGIYRNRT